MTGPLVLLPGGSVTVVKHDDDGVGWPADHENDEKCPRQFHRVGPPLLTLLEVSRHFNRNGHRGLEDVEIHVLDFIHLSITKNATLDIRLGREFDWIHRLHCTIPKGLNSLDGTY